MAFILVGATRFPLWKHVSYCTFSLAVTLFWTREQKAQMRWTANKERDQCSVHTTYYYCEVQNDKPCFWQYQIQSSWLPRLSTNSNKKDIYFKLNTQCEGNKRWNEITSAQRPAALAGWQSKHRNLNGDNLFPLLLHIIFAFFWMLFFFHRRGELCEDACFCCLL